MELEYYILSLGLLISQYTNNLGYVPIIIKIEGPLTNEKISPYFTQDKLSANSLSLLLQVFSDNDIIAPINKKQLGKYFGPVFGVGPESIRISSGKVRDNNNLTSANFDEIENLVTLISEAINPKKNVSSK